MTNADRTAGWPSGPAPTGGGHDRRPPRTPGTPGSRAGAADDAAWRRPTPDTPSLVPPAEPAPAEAETYAGPPRTAPVPPTWRPSVVTPIQPPRTMPSQDGDRLDAEEHAARTLTQGIGVVAGAIILILIFVLCGRMLG